MEALDRLNQRGIDYLISYDGQCGDKHYGEDLPDGLGLRKVLPNAGLSSQSLLLGRKVNFGDLGSFYVSLRSEGVDKAEDFDPNVHVKHIYVHWERSKFFADLKGDKDIKWEYTLTRKEMSDAKKEAKKEATEAAGGGSNSGGGGSSSGEPGDITE